MEGEVEAYLTAHAYGLANRWYSPSTRLTGWAAAAEHAPEPPTPATAIAFGDGTRVSSYQVHPASVQAANQALLVDLAWDAGTAQPGRRISLRLADAQGITWAQQDLPASSPGGPDRLGLLVPSGTPPGTYRLLLSVSPDAASRPLDVLDATGRPQGIEALLAQIEVNLPSQPPSRHTLAVEQSLEATFGDELVRLLGYSAGVDPLAPGTDLKVSLFWQALPPLATHPDLFAFVQLVDKAGQVAAGWEGPPVAWHATTAWQDGEFVRSQHALRLPATMSDGEYRLIAGLFEPATGRRLAADGSDHVLLRTVAVRGRPHVTQRPVPQAPLAADLARLGRLAGYDLSSESASPGQPLELVLYWQATGTTAQRLAVFVHLVDQDGEFLGQSDGEPGQGALPTSSWVPGEYLVDPHLITVASGADPGPARLLVGLYDPATGERVPWLNEQGQPASDVLTLPITVTVSAGE